MVTAEQARKSGAITVVDIEHWPVTGNATAVEASVRKYLTVLEWFRTVAPDVPVGYYGVAPIRDYWRAVRGNGHAEFESWRAENDRVRPVAEAVDALFPSIYTFYTDRNGWKEYAAAQVSEARRLGPDKPVFAFLMPIYHESNRLLGGQHLPGAYWRMQLEFLRDRVDGVVIWGGYKLRWSDDFPWWRETVDFLSTRFDRKDP